MFLVLLAIGALLFFIGGLLFLIDAFRIHWGWGVGSIFVPFVNIICLIKHWAETKRGFLISLFGIPFLLGAILNAPKPVVGPHSTATKPGASALSNNDPFWNAMQRARDAVSKTQASRQDVPTTNAVLSAKPNAAPVAVAPAQSTATPLTSPAATSIAKPTPKPTLPQRLAANRATFKALETQFAALQTKRKALPKKNNAHEVAAFNLDAQAYADQLASARSEQAILLELQRTSR